MMRIAIFTMVHNEAVFLPLWIKHYSKVKNAQLIVIDNGSDDGSTSSLPTEIEKITFPHQEIIRDTLRIEAVSNFQNSLVQYYDRVIYTDVDEFIVVDPALGIDLASFIEQDKNNNIAPIGLNVVHNPATDAAIDFGQPILAQRLQVFFSSSYCKPLITRDKIRWLPGFHGSSKLPWITGNIYLFHLRLVDLGFSLARAEDRMKRTLKGQVWDLWGKTRSEITAVFERENAKPFAPAEKNFNFETEIKTALKNASSSPDGSVQKLGLFDGDHLHKIPERFLACIQGAAP